MAVAVRLCISGGAPMPAEVMRAFEEKFKVRILEFMIEGHFSRAIRRRLMDSKIAALRGHSIVCGFGRVGSRIAEELAQGT